MKTRDSSIKGKASAWVTTRGLNENSFDRQSIKIEEDPPPPFSGKDHIKLNVEATEEKKAYEEREREKRNEDNVMSRIGMVLDQWNSGVVFLSSTSHSFPYVVVLFVVVIVNQIKKEQEKRNW